MPMRETLCHHLCCPDCGSDLDLEPAVDPARDGAAGPDMPGDRVEAFLGLRCVVDRLAGQPRTPRTHPVPARPRVASHRVGAGDDDFYELLVDLAVKLRENDVTGAMWAVIPPWATGMLQKDVRFTNYGTDPNRQTLLNGMIGKAAGFDLSESNNLSGATSGTLAVAGGVYTVLAGVKEAATYAEQIQSIEAFKPHDGFTDAVKGLHNYGAKVTRPFALTSCEVTQA